MVKGIPALRKRMAAVPKNIRKEAQKAAKSGAEDIADATRRLVPVEFGKLRSTVSVQPIGKAGSRVGKAFGKDFGKFGYSVRYGDQTTIVGGRSRKFQLARVQEFGTKTMPANPALFPAYRSLRSVTKGRITRAIKKGVKNS